MRWPTVAHWLARDGWFAETAGVLLPKPPRSMDTNIIYLPIQNGKVHPKPLGRWIQILCTYEYKTAKYFLRQYINVKFLFSQKLGPLDDVLA